MTGYPNRSPIARMMPQAETDKEDLEKMRRAAWRKQGVLVIDPERIANYLDRQHLINIGNKVYGKRAEQK